MCKKLHLKFASNHLSTYVNQKFKLKIDVGTTLGSSSLEHSILHKFVFCWNTHLLLFQTDTNLCKTCTIFVRALTSRKNGSKNFFHIPCDKESFFSFSSSATTKCQERRRIIISRHLFALAKPPLNCFCHIYHFRCKENIFEINLDEWFVMICALFVHLCACKYGERRLHKNIKLCLCVCAIWT